MYCWYAFDCSASSDSFDTDFCPAPRVGYYRLHVNFSEGTPVNLNAVLLSEFPSSITVSKDSKIERSYAV